MAITLYVRVLFLLFLLLIDGIKPFGKCDIKLLFNVDYKFAV